MLSQRFTVLATAQKHFAVCVSLFLCACSGSGDGKAVELNGTINGSVQGGYGRVQIYSFSNGKKNSEAIPYGDEHFDPEGHFSATLKVTDQPLLVEVISGSYSEAESNVSVPLQNDTTWRAVINYKSGQSSKLSVNAWTTIATGLAEYKVKMGAPASQAVDEANAEFSAMLGVDILATPPRMLRYLAQTEPITHEIEYGYFIAAISQWTAYASTVNQDAVHTFYSSALFAQRAYDDIRYDGLLDGKGATGTINFGTLPQNQTIYRHDLAINLLQFAQNLFNAGGPKTDELLPAATRLNNSTETIFGSNPVIALDATGPIITSVLPAENASVYGPAVRLSAAITDLIGVSAVEVSLDNEPLGTPTNLINPVLLLDSTKLKEGLHVLTFKATNLVGTRTVVDRHFAIYNKSTSITNIIPVANTYVSKFVPVSASVSDPAGLKSVEFFVGANSQGLATDLSAPSVLMDTTRITDGPHTLSVVAINNAGSTLTVGVPWIFDNTVPVIAATAPAVNSYHKGTFTTSATVTDTNLLNAEFFLDGNSLGVAADKYNAAMQIDTTKYPDRAYTLAVVAKDKAANLTTQTIPVFFDNTAPVIANIDPPAGTVIGNEQFNVRCTVADLSIADIEYHLDGKYYSKSSSLVVPTTFIVGSELTPGTHTIKIIATDKAGNVSTATTTVVH